MVAEETEKMYIDLEYILEVEPSGLADEVDGHKERNKKWLYTFWLAL